MNLAPTDPLAVQLTGAVQSGELAELARLLDEQPELANARIAGRRGGWRTPLHLASYSDQAPLDVAGGVDTRRGQLVSWLRERGATPAKP
jgi:hypothetical protein